MPTPIEILLAPSSIVVITIYFGLITLETIFPGRALPIVKR